MYGLYGSKVLYSGAMIESAVIKIDSGGVIIVGKKIKINEVGSAGVTEPDEARGPRVADPAVDGHRGRVSNAKPLS